MYRPDLQCTLFLIAPVDQRWSSFLPEIQQAAVPIVPIVYRFDRKNGNGFLARSYNWLSRHWRERFLNHEFFSALQDYPTVVCAEFFVADLLLPHLKPYQRLCFHLMEHVAQRSDTSHYRLLHSNRLNLIYMHASQIVQLADPHPLPSSITWPVRLCPDHIRLPPKTAPDPAGRLRIAHYSRISPMRFIDQVIDAFHLLYQRTSSTLRIAGFIEDPDYYNTLLTRIQRLGLADVVHFDQPVPSPAEDPALVEVDLVWMISLSGHIGYAGIEAMAAGLPTLLLEVDSQGYSCELETELAHVICRTPAQIVERSLDLIRDPHDFKTRQSVLLNQRFITTPDSISDLTAFYLLEQ